MKPFTKKVAVVSAMAISLCGILSICIAAAWLNITWIAPAVVGAFGLVAVALAVILIPGRGLGIVHTMDGGFSADSNKVCRCSIIDESDDFVDKWRVTAWIFFAYVYLCGVWLTKVRQANELAQMAEFDYPSMEQLCSMWQASKRKAGKAGTINAIEALSEEVNLLTDKLEVRDRLLLEHRAEVVSLETELSTVVHQWELTRSALKAEKEKRQEASQIPAAATKKKTTAVTS